MRNRDDEVIGVLGCYEDITERKQVIDALQESEERLRAFFENMHDAAIITDEKGKIIAWNPAAVKIFGIPASRACNLLYHEMFMEVMVPKHRASAKYQPVTQVIHEGVPTGESNSSKPIELEILRWDGSRIIIRHVTFSIPTANGFRLASISTDITEYRNVQEQLRLNEEKFHDIFDLVNDGIHIHEIDPGGMPGKFIEVNKSACDMVKYSREELLSRSPFDLMDGFHNPPLQEVINDLSTTGHTVFESEHRKKDGEIIPVEINTHVVTLQGKKVMVSVARDITERKRVEKALRDSRERFYEMAQLLPQIVFEMDTTFRYTFANKYALEHCGYIDEDLERGLYAYDLIPARLHEQMQKSLNLIKQNIGNPHAEFLLLRKDKTEIPVRIFTSGIFRNGELIGYRGVAVDLTDFKKIEDELTCSRDYFATIFNSVNDAIIIQDPNTGMILDANETACRILGYSKSEFLSSFVQNWDKVGSPYGREDAMKIIMAARTIGPQNFDWYQLCKDGNLIHVKVNVRSVMIGKDERIIMTARVPSD